LQLELSFYAGRGVSGDLFYIQFHSSAFGVQRGIPQHIMTP